MIKDDHFFLRLDDFQTTVRKSWQKNQTGNSFHDVTFACEDRQIKAHKIIVAFYSPILKNLLQLNQHPHPLIYLRKVRFRDLESLLDFMYQGEVSIAGQDLSIFLEMAKDLEIIGLSETNREDYTLKEEDSSHKDYFSGTSLKRKRSTEYEETKNKIVPYSVDSHLQFEHIHANLGDGAGLDDSKKEPKAVDSEPANFETYEKDGKCKQTISFDGQTLHQCGKCDKKFHHKGGLWKHEKAIHEGIFYFCDLCDYRSPQKVNLQKHIENKHEKVKHCCNQCDYKAATKVSLQKHILIEHYSEMKEDLPILHELDKDLKIQGESETEKKDGMIASQNKKTIKYENGENTDGSYSVDSHLQSELVHDNSTNNPDDTGLELKKKNDEEEKKHKCPKCGKEFCHKGGLWKHEKSIHEGILFYCDKCDYKAPQKVNLQIHIEKNHDGIRHYCHYCDHKATTKGNLQKHLSVKHYVEHSNTEEALPILYESDKDLKFNLLSEPSKEDVIAVTLKKEINKPLSEKAIENLLNNEKDAFDKDLKITPILETKKDNDIGTSETNKSIEYEYKKEQFKADNQLEVQWKEGKIVDGQKQYACGKCNKEFYHRGGLWKHIKAIHEGIFYFCNNCDYKSTQKVNLQKHTENKH